MTLQIDKSSTVWRSPLPSLIAGLRSLPLVLLMHGKGSNEQVMLDRLPGLPSSVVVASVRAPYACGDGWSWFPPAEVPSWRRPTAQFQEAGKAIVRWADDVAPNTPIIPVGFSQGAAMAAQLTRMIPSRVLGAGVFSGFVHAGAEPGDALATDVPVFVAHGDADHIVPFEAGEEVAERMNAPLHVMPEAGHVMTPLIIEDFYDFVADCIEQTY